MLSCQCPCCFSTSIIRFKAAYPRFLESYSVNAPAGLGKLAWDCHRPWPMICWEYSLFSSFPSFHLGFRCGFFYDSFSCPVILMVSPAWLVSQLFPLLSIPPLELPIKKVSPSLQPKVRIKATLLAWLLVLQKSHLRRWASPSATAFLCF